jgi:hypothetical protein
MAMKIASAYSRMTDLRLIFSFLEVKSGTPFASLH